MNREDFNILKSGLIYFDNGATTLKPKLLGDVISDYYNNYSANAHRGDYDISLKVDSLYENTRKLVKEFINANSSSEIIFTNNATDSINKIVFGFFEHYLKENDEILITKAEHASNILPWFELSDKINVKVNYMPLNENLELTLDSVKNSITDNTKVISIAHVTNVIGDVRPIKEIIEYVHKHNILVLIDGAQSVPHMKIDVQELDMDFLVFSAHKMCGPTGVGVIYGKEKYLNNTYPIIFGGGMNSTFEFDGFRVYKEIPTILEAGTPNIAGVIGFGEVLKYLKNIGIDKIHEYEVNLREYAINKLKELDNIILYNKDEKTGIITFNIEGVFPQDTAIYLNKYHICVRAGSHCAKILKDDLGIKNTVRMSLYFYNTKEEVDKLIEVLRNKHILEEAL